MAEDKPREFELYICNKFPLKLDQEIVTFCNAPQQCDSETRQRRRCVGIKVVVLPSKF